MNKKILSALRQTILFFAVFHLIILIFLFVTTVNFEFLNIFKILELSVFYEGIDKGTTSFLASSIVIGAVFLYFYSKKGN